MIRVFLDANVYFSAARSKAGASAAILELAKSKHLSVYATPTVLREAERNIRIKESLATRLRFYDIAKDVAPKRITIDKKRAEKTYMQVINRKDAYVLESVRKAKADFLVTLDRKHFMSRKMKATHFPFRIVTPGQLIRAIAF